MPMLMVLMVPTPMASLLLMAFPSAPARVLTPSPRALCLLFTTLVRGLLMLTPSCIPMLMVLMVPTPMASLPAYHYIGKRSADAEPKADADALLYTSTYVPHTVSYPFARFGFPASYSYGALPYAYGPYAYLG